MPRSVNNCRPCTRSLSHDRLQAGRLVTRVLFFLLFLLAPALDLFRLDLDTGGFILFGRKLSLGLAGISGEAPVDPLTAGLSILTHAIIPVVLIIAVVLIVSWRYGRLYCGWLCPHFSVVAMINALMIRARGKPTLWEPATRPNNPWGWIVTLLAALVMAFVWAVFGLTYLIPPPEVFHNLLHATPTPNQARFIGIGTLLFFIDFLFARHLFCRFGCAAGLFQSLPWMANRTALLPLFARERAGNCRGCPQSCDTACPMRLKPRGGKNAIATCTQCGLCLQACDRERGNTLAGSPLTWMSGPAVLPRSGGYTELPQAIPTHRSERKPSWKSMSAPSGTE
ncbi:MAG: 4Fe-4S binding protein [Magnetococcales bacterium]|nr:4Fe-4S binding protein [Magnetococcales bacterium]